MGLMDRVQAACVDERGLAFVDRHGRRRATMPADAFGGEGIVAEIEIMRGDLTNVLYEATRADVEYLFNDRIAELAPTADGVTVTFASGTVREFDLVVGADGVHSGVRALAFGPESTYVRHLGGYTSYFSVPDPGDLDGWFHMYNAPGGRVAGIRPDRDGIAKASLSFTSPPLTYDRRDRAAQEHLLTKAFAGSGWRVPSLLAAMPVAADFYFDAICQVHVDRWWRGRVALVGDAGYSGSPLTGLGTTMAMVGAYVLAGELAATPDDHESAYGRYQEELRAYVAAGLKLPPGGINGFAPRSRFMIAMRNRSMAMMTAWPMRNLLAKQFSKAEAITLKEYGLSLDRPAASAK
jgi:2-polyprenyl-6-methoxyphenol hydroxylase-like FAD-dependent oxidoreductase